jgi:hypothetical protein
MFDVSSRLYSVPVLVIDGIRHLFACRERGGDYLDASEYDAEGHAYQ